MSIINTSFGQLNKYIFFPDNYFFNTNYAFIHNWIANIKHQGSPDDNQWFYKSLLFYFFPKHESKIHFSKIKFLWHKTVARELTYDSILCSKWFPQFWNLYALYFSSPRKESKLKKEKHKKYVLQFLEINIY